MQRYECVTVSAPGAALDSGHAVCISMGMHYGRSLLTALLTFCLSGCGGAGAGGGRRPEGPDLTFADSAWLWSGRGAGNDFLSAIDAFPDGSTVVVGVVGGEALLEDGRAVAALDPATGALVIARFHADGTLLWARTDGLGDRVDGRGVVANPDGSCLVAGTFRSAATFGVGDTSETTLQSRGGSDIFLARYTATGTLEWVRQAGGPAAGGGMLQLTSDTVRDMAGFHDGSCVLVGHYSEGTTFGEAANEILVSGSTGDSMYVARYDADGTVRWAEGISFTSSAYACVAARPDGSCVVAGLIPTLSMRTGGDGTTRIGARALNRVDDGWSFFAAYDADGSALWAHGCGVGAQLVPQDLVGLSEGSFAVVGEAVGNVRHVRGMPAVLTPALDGRRSFLGHFDPDGTATWVRKDDCVSMNRIAQRDGSLIIAGMLQFAATLGADSPTETVIDRGPNWSTFLARFETQGTLAWARGEGGPGLSLTTHPGDLALLPDGRIALAANFQGLARIGEREPLPIELDSIGAWDFLVTVYDAHGGFPGH